MAAETGALLPNAIPADFEDRLQDEFLLAPDADYPWARFAYSAMLAAEMQEFDLLLLQYKEGRLGSQGLLSNLPEAMSNAMGGPLVLSNMVYPDFVKMVSDPSKKHRGEVIKINRPRYIDGTVTEATRKLSPATAFFASSGQAPTMDQVDVTIFEYGGPTDASGNLSPINLAEFTSQMSVHDLVQYSGLQLRRDRWRYLNYLIETRLIDAAAATSDGVTYPTGVTGTGTTGGLTAQGAEPFTFDLLVRAGEALKGRKVPGIAAQGRYVGVLDIHQVADLKLDPMYQRLARYDERFNPLFPGYISTAENFVICETNGATRLSSIGAGSALTGYQGLIVAPNCFGWASAMQAKCIRDRNDDGGRFNRWGWHAYEGYQVLDDRFVQKIVTD